MQKREFIITFEVLKKPTEEFDSLIGNALLDVIVNRIDNLVGNVEIKLKDIN